MAAWIHQTTAASQLGDTLEAGHIESMTRSVATDVASHSENRISAWALRVRLADTYSGNHEQIGSEMGL